MAISRPSISYTIILTKARPGRVNLMMVEGLNGFGLFCSITKEIPGPVATAGSSAGGAGGLSEFSTILILAAGGISPVLLNIS